jgi:hypothetical protein
MSAASEEMSAFLMAVFIARLIEVGRVPLTAHSRTDAGPDAGRLRRGP